MFLFFLQELSSLTTTKERDASGLLKELEEARGLEEQCHREIAEFEESSQERVTKLHNIQSKKVGEKNNAGIDYLGKTWLIFAEAN